MADYLPSLVSGGLTHDVRLMVWRMDTKGGGMKEKELCDGGFSTPTISAQSENSIEMSQYRRDIQESLRNCLDRQDYARRGPTRGLTRSLNHDRSRSD